MIRYILNDVLYNQMMGKNQNRLNCKKISYMIHLNHINYITTF